VQQTSLRAKQRVAEKGRDCSRVKEEKRNRGNAHLLEERRRDMYSFSILSSKDLS
jgi:hypothetical protein